MFRYKYVILCHHITTYLDFELNSEDHEPWTNEWMRTRSPTTQSVGPPELTINFGVLGMHIAKLY